MLALGTVGIPVLLWMGYGLRGAIVLLACILLFWHILVAVPPFGSGGGGSPAFNFVFFFAPLYLAAYALLATGEY